MVRNFIPIENLLEFTPGDGWGPLRQFLGHDVPENDFARVNDAKAFQEWWDSIVTAVAWRAGYMFTCIETLLVLGTVSIWCFRGLRIM
jgi:hypothetical protein